MSTILKKNKDKLYEEEEEEEEEEASHNYMIQPSDQCVNLIDAIKLILKFNEKI